MADHTTPRPLILAFDTARSHVAAVLGAGTTVLSSIYEEMARGQAERLPDAVEEMLGATGIEWSQIGLVAAGVGPGNFTGIRISVAYARGLSLGLDRPAVGVSAFDLSRDAASPLRELVSVEGPRGQAYVQAFAAGSVAGPPEVIDPAAPPARLARDGLQITGWRAEQIAGVLGCRAAPRAPDALAADLPRRLLAAAHKNGTGATAAAPVPLYVRPADAAPSREPPPRIFDDA